MKTRDEYINAYGPQAGPILYRTLKSRAAYKGVSTRRRHQIEAVTGRPFRDRRRRRPSGDAGQGLLPLSPASDSGQVPSRD